MKCQHSTAVCVVSVYRYEYTQLVIIILLCMHGNVHMYFKDVLDCG